MNIPAVFKNASCTAGIAIDTVVVAKNESFTHD